MNENTGQEKLDKAVKYLSEDDAKREKELQEKGLNAPRLNPQMIADQILTKQFLCISRNSNDRLLSYA